MAYAFLSDEWLVAVKQLADDAGEGGALPGGVSLNLVVTGGPAGDRHLHLADGTFAQGLIDSAPTKLTVPYGVARQMFVEGNQAAAMQAFMSGQIKVEGDMTKLMAMQAQGNGSSDALQQQLQDLTAPD